ncbi:hypothetical protein WIW50_02370 [Flavobacteriaceae bacterium 3-367]
MKFDTALNRIIWRFQNFDRIRVNEKDIEALNKIVDYINKYQKHDFENNKYFAKLYAYNLGCFLEKYNATIDERIAHTQLHKLLERPFKNIVADVTSQMNFRCKYSILKTAGYPVDKHPAITTCEERTKALSRLRELIELGDNKRNFLGNPWSQEEVEKGLKSQITNFIHGI